MSLPSTGLILVHDLSNKRSYDNLQLWLAELTGTSPDTKCGLLMYHVTIND
jgi:hypothetical protein